MSYVDKGIMMAQRAALTSDCPNFKVGAVLMKANRTISIGRNWFKKSHPQSQTIWNGIHAEFNCLNKINLGQAKNCTIFVVRIRNSGDLAMARPCEHCQQLINNHGIKAVYYTDIEGQICKERLNAW